MDFMPLITALSAWQLTQCSAHLTYLACTSSFCLWWCYGRQHWKPCKSQHKQHMPLCPQLLSHSYHCPLVRHDFPFTNPRCLLLIPFLSLICLEAVSKRICSIALAWIELKMTGLLFPGSFFLSVLKTRVTFGFLQSLGTSPDLHDISEIIMGGFTMTLVNTLISCGGITSDHMDLCTSYLFKCFPTWSSSLKDMSSLLQSFSLEKSDKVVKMRFLQQRHYRRKDGVSTFFAIGIERCPPRLTHLPSGLKLSKLYKEENVKNVAKNVLSSQFWYH